MVRKLNSVYCVYVCIFAARPDTQRCNLGVCKYLSTAKSNTRETAAWCWVCARSHCVSFRVLSRRTFTFKAHSHPPSFSLSAPLEPLLENFFVYNCVKFLCSASACALAETTFRPERITLLTFSVCQKGSAHTQHSRRLIRHRRQCCCRRKRSDIPLETPSSRARRVVFNYC